MRAFIYNRALRKLTKYYCQICHRYSSSYESGKLYELVTVFWLRRFLFEVTHSGKRGDRGVDFRGCFKLKEQLFPVVGQCKYHKRKMARVGPSHVREMEGVLSQEGEATLGVLVNNIGFTSLAYEHFMSSPLPLIFVVITDRHRLSLVSGITLTKKLDSHDKLGQTKLKWQLQADAVCGGSKEKDKVLNHDAATDRTLDCNDQQQNMANQQTPQNNCGKKVIERNSDAYDGWRLSLFELNPPARTLLPNLVIGLTMGTDGHRVPNLMALTL